MGIINPDPNKKRSKDLRQVSLLGAVPALLVAGPLVGYFLGHWLDGVFETDPALMIILVVLGFGSAGVEIYRLVKRSSAIEDEEDEE